MNERNVAVAELSFDTLTRLLGLPEGQRVARAEYSIERDCLRLLLEGPGLPLIPQGCPAMTLSYGMREVKRLELDWDVGHG
jgi:hypothetical protein